MKRAMLTLLAPPFAVCIYGCAGCCAAPIGVFWLTGIFSIAYGIVGGPTNLLGPSWNTILLGLGLWAIASTWAALAIRRSSEDGCEGNSRFCERFTPDPTDESDPMDEVRKAR